MHEQKRRKWANPLNFAVCCISMSMGLGNIWRFPFMVFENGGSTFLISYIIVLVLVGRPTYYFELALGQFCGRSNVKLFSVLAKSYVGIGISQTFCCICVATYYSAILAIIVFYFTSSFSKTLMWDNCKPEWGDRCFSLKGDELRHNSSYYITSVELFFRNSVLNEHENIEDGISAPDRKLALCLFVSWLTSFLILVEGFKASTRVLYFIMIFPMLVLFTLLGTTAALDGATNGIDYLVEPKWSELLDLNVWYHAITQCFFSLGLGFGTILTVASYNAFDSDIYMVSLIVVLVDTATSILVGLMTFATLGHLALQLNVKVEDVVKSGGLAVSFISYSAAVSHFKIAPHVMSVLFFLVLFGFGVGTLATFQHVVNTQLVECFPTIKYWQVSALTSILGFLVALFYITPQGMFILTLIDSYCVSKLICIITIFELLVVVYAYGLQNFCWDIEFMIHQKMRCYWRLLWAFVTPLVLIVVYAYYMVSLKHIIYKRDQLPTYVAVYGWLLYSFGVLVIPLGAILQTFKQRHSGCPAMLQKAFSNERWRPVEERTAEAWKVFKDEEKRKRAERGNNACTDFLKSLLNM